MYRLLWTSGPEFPKLIFTERAKAEAFAREHALHEYTIAPIIESDSIMESRNPKDLQGIKKPSLGLLPAAGLIHGAMAAKNGADKYGPYNWRDQKIAATVYLDAILRHVYCVIDREDYCPKSLAHHLGHVIAGASIYLDAMETGNLIDDRPTSGCASSVIDRFTQA